MDGIVINLTSKTATPEDAQVGRMVEMLLTLFGVTNAALAAELGISPQALSNKLHGSRPWSHSEVKRTAAWFDVPSGLLNADPADFAATLRTPGRSINYRSSA